MEIGITKVAQFRSDDCTVLLKLFKPIAVVLKPVFAYASFVLTRRRVSKGPIAGELFSPFRRLRLIQRGAQTIVGFVTPRPLIVARTNKSQSINLRKRGTSGDLLLRRRRLRAEALEAQGAHPERCQSADGGALSLPNLQRIALMRHIVVCYLQR